MARWQLSASAVTIAPFSPSISSSFGTAVISFDFASVAICASTRRCSQPQAETMCNGDLPLARSNERRRTLPSIATTPSHGSEKPAQEGLLRLGEQAHVYRALPAAQNRAHRYRQNLMKVVQRSIAGARVVQTVPAFDKAIQDLPPRRESPATR